MAQADGAVIGPDQTTPNVPGSEIDEAVQIPIEEPTATGQPQPEATGLPQPVESQSSQAVASASSAAPVDQALTVAHMEDNIARRLMDAMSAQLERLVIQQQQPSPPQQQRRRQRAPQQ